MLSRLPLPETPTDIPMPGETILVIDMLLSLPVIVEHIRQWTMHDPILSRVRALVQQGWQDTDDVGLKPFQRRKYELSIHDGCLLWGSDLELLYLLRVEIRSNKNYMRDILEPLE